MATETSVLTGLEPRAFWGHFESLTKIPRPSRHEEPVIEQVRSWADQHGFEVQHDGGRNLVTTGTTSLGKRDIDHLFQLPLQVCWIVTALVGILIVWLFFGGQTPVPPT